MLKILIYLWTLPQSVLGWLLSLFCRKSTLHGKRVYLWRFSCGLSLADYIFVNKDASVFTVAHEYGHRRQSLYLGWLYLLIIGIPSITWASLYTLFWERKKCYYDFYTERWANNLAGYEAWLGADGITYYRKKESTIIK